MIDETVRELRTQVRRLERRYERLSQRIKEIRQHLSSSGTVEQKPVEQKPATLPAQVRDKESLKAFARSIMAERFDSWLTANEMETAAKELRDALVEHYPDIALHPRWQNTESRHLDAVYWMSGNAIVDIVRASDEAGRISTRLQWLVYPEGGE